MEFFVFAMDDYELRSLLDRWRKHHVAAATTKRKQIATRERITMNRIARQIDLRAEELWRDWLSLHSEQAQMRRRA